MHIPDNCTDWADLMGLEDHPKLVLEQLSKDNSSPPHLVQDFFTHIFDNFTGTTAQEAWDFACEIVNSSTLPGSNMSKYILQGNEVPDGEMPILFRVCSVDYLAQCLNDSSSDLAYDLQAQIGTIPVEFRKNDWPQNLNQSYIGILVNLLRNMEWSTGTPNSITWVTDKASLNPQAILKKDTILRLGLPRLKDAKWLIVLEYPRAMVPPLHVPRAFDGIGHWPFEVQEDNNARFGMTKPLDGCAHTQGLPEAVHESVMLKIDALDIMKVES